MSSLRTLLISLLCWGTLSVPRLAAAQRASDEKPVPVPVPEPYFYKGYDYGSQALYGPLWVFLNRGYDVLQDRTGSRSIFQQEYLHNGENVGRNLLNPFPGISQRGWGRFFREEIFPLSFTQGHGALGTELHAAPDRRWRDVHRPHRMVPTEPRAGTAGVLRRDACW